jgi:hypothetical protein
MEQGFDHSFELNSLRHQQLSIIATFMTLDHRVDFLQKILRGELSAVEAYEKVIERNGSHVHFSTLAQIKSEHEFAINRLRQMITEKGEFPSEDSGVWGRFVKALIAGSALISDETMIKTLHEGEEHGLIEYQQFLDMGPLASEEEQVRSYFIPAQERHISQLMNSRPF